jgi:hypothetical protein
MDTNTIPPKQNVSSVGSILKKRNVEGWIDQEAPLGEEVI